MDSFGRFAESRVVRHFLFMIKPDRDKTGIDVHVGFPLCSAWSTGWARVLDIARTDDLLVPLHRYLALVAVAYG